MCRCRFSHVDGRRLLRYLGSAAASEPRMYVVIRAARTAPDRKMSCAIVVARTSVTPLEPRTSCVAVATRTSRGAVCSPALEVLPPRGPGGAASCPHKGTVVARPLDRGATVGSLGTAASTPDRGTAATARRGRGAAATAATGRGPPPRALSGNRRC
jgi:hypothetical protein